MSNIKPRIEMTDLIDQGMTPEQIAARNAKMRAAASPKMQNIMDEVQAAIDAENAHMKARLDGENRLRAWAKQLCGVTLDISEIEELRDIIVGMRNGQTTQFRPKRGDAAITLYKNAVGTIDRLENYIFALEKVVIDLSQNKTPVPFNFTSVRVLQYTNLSFFGLIKLAFKQLFKRSK